MKKATKTAEATESKMEKTFTKKKKSWWKIALWVTVITAAVGGFAWWIYTKFFYVNQTTVQADVTNYANKYGSNSGIVAKIITDEINEILYFKMPEVNAYATANNMSVSDAVAAMAYAEVIAEGLLTAYPLTTTPPPISAH